MGGVVRMRWARIGRSVALRFLRALTLVAAVLLWPTIDVGAGSPGAAVTRTEAGAPADGHAGATVIRNGPRERRWVALTFDDGWSVGRCARIVRTLRAKRAPATFFVNGAIINRDPARWRRLLAGFSVANHTLSHKDLTRLDTARIRGQIAINERVIEQALGRPILRLLRPPYGAYDPTVLRIAAALGYHTILWDTDGGDGRSGATTRSIIRSGRSGRDGAIVLLHCGPGATPAAVGPIIEHYRARGYRLVDLGTMLDLEPPPTACRVTNADADETTTSLQRAVLVASAGDRLTLQGTCLGTVHIRKDLEISGTRTQTSGTPTLDGAGKRAVVTVRPGATVTLRDVSIQGGRRGVLNRGSLVLHDVLVLGNGADLDGAGVYNAAGGTLTLHGSSSIRHNTGSRAGGGVLNAGTLVLSESSSIAHNVVRDAGVEAPGAVTGIDPTTAASPPPSVSPSGGAGGGVMNLGVMLGAVCGPAEGANIRANSPDDCGSAGSAGPATSPAP